MDASIRATLVAVSATLTNPEFKAKLDAFTDANCDEFLVEGTQDVREENKLAWTQLHEKYQELIEEGLGSAVSEDKMAELLGALEGLLKNKDSVNEALGEFDTAIEILVAITEFPDFKTMMHARALIKQGKQQHAQFAENAAKQAGAATATNENARDEVDALLMDTFNMQPYGREAGAEWECVAESPQMHVLAKQDDVSGVKTFRTTILMDYDPKIVQQCFLDSILDPARAEWDSDWSTKNQLLKKDETGAYFLAHLDHVPAFLKWAMGMPDSYTMRIQSKPLPSGGSAYVMASWDMEKNQIAQGEGAFELKKSGSVRPHEEAGKCVMMDLSEMKTWMPTWIMGKVMTGAVGGKLNGRVDGYLKWRAENPEKAAVTDTITLNPATF